MVKLCLSDDRLKLNNEFHGGGRCKVIFVSYLISIVDVVVGVVKKRISKFRAEWLTRQDTSVAD